MASPNPVPKLYQSVIDDVVSNVRESFLDDGVDEQVLQELKQLWENKLSQSKAVDGLAGKDPEVGQYAQHQHLIRQVQPAAPPAQATVTRTIPQPRPVVTQAHQQAAGQHPVEVQLPVFNQQTGHHVEMSMGQAALQLPNFGQISGAAAQAQSALGGLFPGGTVTLQTPNGPMQFIIQAPGVGGQQTTVPHGVGQVDGPQDSSSDDDDDDDDGDDDDADNDDDENDEDQGEEEEPLNSEDDVSDQDPNELFDTDNVVVCQFDKINRAKNKWKFYLKDGIMNLKGKDYVFQKCNGDAEW